jgi:hypothetical protein
MCSHVPVHLWDIVQDNLFSAATASTNVNSINHPFDFHPIPKPDDVVVYTPDANSVTQISSGSNQDISRNYMEDFKSGTVDGSVGRLADSRAWSDEYMDGWMYSDHMTLQADTASASTIITISTVQANRPASSRMSDDRHVHSCMFSPTINLNLISVIPSTQASNVTRHLLSCVWAPDSL